MVITLLIFVDVGAAISRITDREKTRFLMGDFLYNDGIGSCECDGKDTVRCLCEFSFEVHSAKNKFLFDGACIISVDKDNFVSGIISQNQREKWFCAIRASIDNEIKELTFDLLGYVGNNLAP